MNLESDPHAHAERVDDAESASLAGDPAIRVKSVAKRFGRTIALDEASLELRRGERLALLGPNGAGKSTLVRCISGRVAPDGGEIEMFGEILPSTGPRRRLGFVPQEVALYADLTARENLDAFARFHGLRGGDGSEAVEWALAWTGLADRADDVIKTFSGGMKRRVNLACGVLHRPMVLLLDEPTVGVDPQSRERIFVMLDELADQGTSVLLTTHQLDEAEQRCDRIIIIDHGRVIAQGTLSELISKTVGVNRKVRFELAEPGPKLDGMVMSDDRREIIAEVEDIDLEMPQLLTRIRAGGSRVTHIEVNSPSLHAVFIHLTGRELRE